MPVYLWERGLDLAGLCLLLGVSGLAFSAALGPWQRIARERPLSRLIAYTFVFELALVAAVLFGGALLGGDVSDGGASAVAALVAIVAVGVANGVYNAFFWSTQRTLFTGLGSGDGDTGRRYGNLQIVVAVFLKVGILMGGLLIDAGMAGWVLLASAAVGLLATRGLARDTGSTPLHDEPAVGWREALGRRDAERSAAVFAVDGPFLYLESHFWTLSLFLLVAEDHSRLGFVVVALGIVFALLFLLIKNRIDRSAIEGVYRASVALYALSWLLRAAVPDGDAGAFALALLIAVTFCSSLFRLAFNKRFFDVARTHGTPVSYLMIKSHASQLWLAAVFLPLGVVLHIWAFAPNAALNVVYLAAAVLSLVYLRYRRPAASQG